MINWIIDTFIILFILWFVFKRMAPIKGIKQISTQELKTILKDKNKQFIDVRTTGEFTANHIHVFKNIPLNQLPNKLNMLSNDKQIVVICQSGMRSFKASKLLKNKGFQNVINVKGGMNAWSN